MDNPDYSSSPTYCAIQRFLDRPDGKLQYLKPGDKYRVNDLYEVAKDTGNEVRVVGSALTSIRPGDTVTMSNAYQIRPRRYIAA